MFCSDQSAQFRAAMRMARACDPKEIEEAKVFLASVHMDRGGMGPFTKALLSSEDISIGITTYVSNRLSSPSTATKSLINASIVGVDLGAKKLSKSTKGFAFGCSRANRHRPQPQPDSSLA